MKTTCDRGHDPIEFTGLFSALCPLCAAREALAAAEEKLETALAGEAEATEMADSWAKDCRAADARVLALEAELKKIRRGE